MISFTDPGSNWFITSCSLQAKSDPRPSRAQPTFGKWTKLSQRTKPGRFIVFRFRCWLKEHEANRLPGYAGVQICVSQGAQGGRTFSKINECLVLSSYYKELKEGRNQQNKNHQGNTGYQDTRGTNHGWANNYSERSIRNMKTFHRNGKKMYYKIKQEITKGLCSP